MVDTAVTEAPFELPVPRDPQASSEPLVAAAKAAEARRVSPGAHLVERFAAAEVGGARAVRIREVPFLTMVGLRAELGSVAAERIASGLGVALPSTVGAVSTGDGVSVLWLGPDEFLAVFEQGDGAELVNTLRQAQGAGGQAQGALRQAQGAGRQAQGAGGQAQGAGSGSVVDLSANRTTFELAGPSARAVLEKGCPLDLHPRSFAVGSAYVTLIGSVPVLLWKVADETYRILPRSSYADFLGRWLLDAMAEFAAPEPL